MADKIYITISSTTTGSGQSANVNETQGGQPQQQPNQPKPNKAGESNVIADGMKTILVDAGKKVLSTAVSQFGNLTGNTIMANNLQGLVRIGSYALAIKAGGWIGAASVAVDIGVQSFNSFIETRKTNAQIELLRQRSGNATINGSRGTYD